MSAKQLPRLLNRFQTSRAGTVSAWVSIGVTAGMVAICLGHLVLRRYSGEPLDLTDGLLLVVGFMAAQGSRAMYVALVLPNRAGSSADK